MRDNRVYKTHESIPERDVPPPSPATAGNSRTSGSTGSPEGAPGRPPGWLRRLRARILAVPGGRVILKLLVALLGAAVVGLGLVLVPLPGPGWAIVIGGLAIWAIEFTWARRLLAWVRRHVRAWTAWVRKQSWPIRLGLGVLALGGLAGTGWLALTIG